MSTKQSLTQHERFETYLQKLSQTQLQEIGRGESEIQFSIVKVPHATTRLLPMHKCPIDCEAIVMELKKIESKDLAMHYLESLCLSKNAYTAILRSLDLPVCRQDNILRMSQKIIEGTIGYHLRSRAILSV